MAEDAVVDQHPDELFGKERVTGAGAGEPLPHHGGCVSEKRVEQRVQVALVERLEPYGEVPVGVAFEELRPGRAQHERRHVVDCGRQALQQLEQCRFGPVDVIDDDDQRPLDRLGGDEPFDRRRCLLGR